MHNEALALLRMAIRRDPNNANEWYTPNTQLINVYVGQTAPSILE